MTIPTKKTVRKATEADIGKHVFVTDSANRIPSVKQVERELGDGRRLGAVVPDVYKPDEPFVTVRSDGFVSTWKSAYTLDEVPMTYQEGQETSGLKPGDWVKVTRKAADGEAGWSDTWPEEMDKFIGSVSKVDRIAAGSGGLVLGGCGHYRYPYFVLEKVTTRPANEEDVGRKCLYYGSEFTIEGIFRSATNGKQWVALGDGYGNTMLAEPDRVQVSLDQPQIQAPEAKKPAWLPEGWRQLGPDEVIQAGDQVQDNASPNPPNGKWFKPYSVGMKVSESHHPKDVWIRKVE